MQTDITLENERKKIIIDTKFYKETLKTNYGAEKISSANLYQLFSYLLNQRKGDTKTQTTTRILLYPAIGQDYDLDFQYQNHNIHIKTVNLNDNWKKNRKSVKRSNRSEQ
ncbi:MAG: 5-methylcytosine restriction system specificity protein McrC [Pyrinomonadaceae bacterium]